MLCVRLSIPCRHALSQTRRKARIRRCSLVFDPPGRPHLPGTSRHSFLRICSRQLLLIRASWHQKYVRPVSDGSMGGDWWITGAAFPSALDGHPPDVRLILFSHTCRFRSSSTMGMEDGPFCQLFCLDHRTDTCQGYVGKFIQRSSVRPTRSVRSSRLAASMGRRAIHRPAFSGKQGPAADASFATTALPLLRNRVSFLALDFYHERHQNVGRLNILVDKTLPGELTQRSCKANTEAEEPA